MNWEGYRDALAQLKLLLAQKRLREALRFVEELLEQSPGSTALLLKQAALIQLLEEGDDLPPLETVRECIERAIELEPESFAPYIELGNFEYAVADDPTTALGLFENAASHAEAGLKAALIGAAKCQLELGRADDAQRGIERARAIFPDDLDLLMIEDELAG